MIPKRVEFYHVENTGYDPDMDQEKNKGIQTGSKMCKLYDLSTERKVELFGRVNLRAYVFHHLGQEIKASHVEIENHRYAVVDSRQVMGKATYTVGEVLP